MTQQTEYWWDKCPLRTYQDIEEFFSTAKNKAKGKPLRKWGRVYKEGDTFEFYYGDKTNGISYAKLTPDNIFTFTQPPHDIRAVCAVTFSSSLYGAVPFMWQRVGLGQYRVQHTSKLPTRQDNGRLFMDWAYMRSSNAPQYEQGLSFNMLTGECLNPPPNYRDQVNDSVKREWLRGLRKFKYAMKTRARIGAFDPIIQAEKTTASGQRSVPDWADPVWLNAMTDAIKTQTIPLELMRGFVCHALHNRWYYHRGAIKGTDVLVAVDEVCNTYSFDLRKQFGVFNAVSPMQEKNEVSRHEVAGDREDNHTQMEV